MPVNFPSIGELDRMGGMDFGAYEQAQNQIGLANQFAQQGLQQGTEDLRTKALANMYSEQVNPLRVENQRLQNEGTGFDNQSRGVKARTDMALEGDDREAKRAKMLADLDEEKLKQLFAKGEALSIDPDPTKAAAGNRMREASWKEQQRRAAAEDSLKQTREITGSREKVAGTNADAKKEAAQIAADAKKASVSSQTDYDSLLLKYAKNPTAQAELRITRAQMLAAQGDAAGAQRELTLAQEARQRVAEDISNKGLATPGIDTAAVAELPANMRPAARATVGTVGPATPGSGTAPPRSAGRGDPPPGSGMVTADEQRDALSVRDKAIADIEAEIKRTRDPAAKAVLQAELDKVRGPAGAKAQPAGVRQGFIPIYKNGKPVGQVPASQADAAKAQGYTLQ
jgi:hypothetical protein